MTTIPAASQPDPRKPRNELDRANCAVVTCEGHPLYLHFVRVLGADDERVINRNDVLVHRRGPVDHDVPTLFVRGGDGVIRRIPRAFLVPVTNMDGGPH